MTFGGSTLGSTTFGGATATATASSGQGGRLFEQIMFAEGRAETTAVRATFKVNPVQATGGRGARLIVPQGTSIKSRMAQDTHAKGITNPSMEELEALLLVL